MDTYTTTYGLAIDVAKELAGGETKGETKGECTGVGNDDGRALSTVPKDEPPGVASGVYTMTYTPLHMIIQHTSDIIMQAIVSHRNIFCLKQICDDCVLR